MSLICVDASVIVRLLVERPGELVERWRGVSSEGRAFVAPALCPFEVTNALHRYVVHGALSGDQADRLVDAALFDLGIRARSGPRLHGRARRLAETLKLKATYDAHYLALAEATGADLWTADRKLAKLAEDRVTEVWLVR